MKKLLLFTFLFSFVTFKLIDAQPVITWQKSLGGSDHEDIFRIIQCSDNGYLVLGSSISNDGQVTGNHGGYDFWVVKLDTAGNIVWQKCYGGTGNEWLHDGVQTSDGGYILAGQTDSNDGDVVGNHGWTDGWIVKIDVSGSIEWQQCLGGSMDDGAASIRQTDDQGFIVAGYAQSTDGQVTGNHGSDDFWVVKLDPSGNLQWEESYGGAGSDDAFDIQITSDNGYIVCGGSNSTDGQITGNHGGDDYWVVKLAPDGTLQWQKCYGGSMGEVARSIQLVSAGGYIMTGYSSSSDGQVSGNHGGKDIWVVKTDVSGNIKWQKCLGGSADDEGQSILQTSEGGYIVTGYTYSTNGQVTGNHGSPDIWAVKLDISGNMTWQTCLGGTAEDYGATFQMTPDSGYIAGGTSNSTDQQVSGNHGGYDYWIIKLIESVTISGGVTDSLGNPINGGKVYLFNRKNLHGGYDTIATGVIANGNYVFNNAPACYGATILAKPDSIGGQAMLPTYLGNTILWTEADTLAATSNTGAKVIQFVQRPPAQHGRAKIHGKVVNNLHAKANDPIDNVGVILKRNGKSSLCGYTSTDATGWFTFENVEMGGYSLILDYPGIPMYTTGGANIVSVANPNDTTIRLIGKVDSAFIRLYPYVGIESLSRDDPVIKLFPNPSSGKFNLSVKNAAWDFATIQISDLQGRVIYSDELVIKNVPDFTKTIDLSTVARGLYFVKIISEKSTKSVLLMIEF